jgi:hypothetical protein
MRYHLFEVASTLFASKAYFPLGIFLVDAMHSEFRKTARPLIRKYIQSARYSNRAKNSRQKNGLIRFLHVGESDALGFLQQSGEEDVDGCAQVPQYGGEIDPVIDSVLYLFSNSSFDADLLDVRQAAVASMSSSRTPSDVVEVVEDEEADEAGTAKTLEWEAFTGSLIPLDEVDLYRCGQRQGTHQAAATKLVGKKRGAKAKGKHLLPASTTLTPSEMRAQSYDIFSAVKEHFVKGTGK